MELNYFAYGEATVPKITVTLRKSYGGAHDVMGCKQLRADINYAWPTAEIAVMGASGAIEILERKNILAIEDEEERKKYIENKINEYTEKFCSPFEAARYGYIDDIIEPRNTRYRIIRSLISLSTKKQNLPPKKLLIVLYNCVIMKKIILFFTLLLFGVTIFSQTIADIRINEFSANYNGDLINPLGK